MNILMHCVYFPPEVGGLESHVFHLCRGLIAKGCSVDVVTSRSLPNTPDHEVMEGIGVWRTWFPSRSPAGWVMHALASVPAVRRLAEGADVLHAQAFSSIPPLAASGSGSKPMVATLHTSHFLVRAERPAWKPVLRKLVRRPDHVFAASEEIRDVANALLGGPARVESLTNGVDTDTFRPVSPTLEAGGRRRLIVPRRLHAKNGVEFLVRAMPNLARTHDVEAVLVGDGPERPRLEALAAELGVEDRVLFLGARPNREMPGLLCSGDVAVIPSLMEATSVAALECMACEVPVAASNVGGLPEIVDASVGTLFAPGDPADLAARVAELLDSDLRSRGRAGRRRVVERWSNDRLVTRHLEVYEQVVRKASPR